MHNQFEPIIPRTRLQGLAVHVGRSRLSLNDEAEVRLTPEGQVGVFVRKPRRWLRYIAAPRPVYLGHLAARAAGVISPRLEREEQLRVRIVGLTPEHLAGEGAPEVHVSIWGRGLGGI